jgi:sulfate permease, SulP family
MAHTPPRPPRHARSDRAADLLRRPPRSLRSVLPVVSWLPRYRLRRDLGADLVAGMALAALLVPESLGFAAVAGVPPEVGLYAALGALVAYAVTGGTSLLVVGPASAVAALAASLSAELGGDTDPAVAVPALAVVAGVVLVVAGAARLGWVVNFISKPVLEAFVAGLCLAIIAGQLGGLLGSEVEAESALGRFVEAAASPGGWQTATSVVGFSALAALLIMQRAVKRVPAAILVVVAGILAVDLFGLEAAGVEVVGDIPQGLPAIAIPDLGDLDWVKLLGGGVALMLVGYSEGFAAASSAAAHTGERVDPDQELMASGFANLAAGVVGGMPVSGSLSKTAASQVAGARSQMANLVSAAIVLATLLFLAPLFEALPEPVLSAIVIAAVLPSADPRRVTRVWSVNRLDFVAGSVTFVLVLVWETLPALLVGIALSLTFLVHRASFPDVVSLERDDTGRYRRGAEPTAREASTLVLRFEAPLIYANADRLVRAVEATLEEQQEATCLVVDAEMMADLDATGAETLRDLDDELRERGVELRLARVHSRARLQLRRSSLEGRFGARTYPSVESAVSGTRPDARSIDGR